VRRIVFGARLSPNEKAAASLPNPVSGVIQGAIPRRVDFPNRDFQGLIGIMAMGAPGQGFLLIADITGYTGFLKDSELEHAQQTLTSLLKLLLSETRDPFVISRTAGDAVISYAFGEPFLQGQTMVDRLEATYIAFSDAIRLMKLNNTCQCAACSNVEKLDLKFFVHHGTFGVQDLDGREELVGNDVNLLHRLTKNSVTETLGLHAYALYTEAALAALGLDEWKASLTPLIETYEHIGDVPICIQDLEALKKERKPTRIPAEKVIFEHSVEIPYPVERVWDGIQDPTVRMVIIGSDKMFRSSQDGRMGEGDKFVCYHGKIETHQVILAWEPLELLITEDNLSIGPARSKTLFEYDLNPTETGTRLTLRVGPTSGSILGRFMHRAMRKGVFKQIKKGLGRLVGALEPS
jgi:uncharacterized protein YndB with AHSA1/START domain